jgi:hypothetical protein
VDNAIVKLIHYYHPEWQEPVDTGYEWISTLCPFHDDTNKSASVSYVKNAFHCFVCDAKGDIISLIMYKEGCGYGQAFRRAEGVLEGSYVALSRGSAKQPRRRIFNDEGFGMGVDQTSSQPIQNRIRW